MRNIGRTNINQLQGIGFKHESQEFLARLSFKDNGFSIEAVVQEDFVWRQHMDLRVAQDESMVHISDVTCEKVMVGEDGSKAVGLNLFPDGHHHKAKCWG